MNIILVLKNKLNLLIDINIHASKYIIFLQGYFQLKKKKVDGGYFCLNTPTSVPFITSIY